MSEHAKLVIPSDPAKLVDVDAFAEHWIGDMPFTDDQRDDIAISLSEAVNNAIQHGNANDARKRVTVVLRRFEDGLRIEVTDEGNGFDPDAVADPTDPENLLSESGRGLLIIRHLMDEVHVRPADGGTRVELIKRYHD
ncbi:MAG: Serine-protein kinase RsbW [Calditrichaeota bacterium]|nr:Serine-protein kinase RsbW [Calditrichota bacterium]